MISSGKSATLRLIGILAIAMVTAIPCLAFAAVPSANQWSPQKNVLGYTDEANAPYLVADRNRSVHAINSLLIDKQTIIVYSQWSPAKGWSEPVDILLPPRSGEALVQGAFLDHMGTLHTILYSGNEQDGAAIYYSRAPASEAGNATAWSSPVAIGEDAGPISNAALASDDNGNLFVVYVGRRDGVGVYGVLSRDNGDTWSEPVLLGLAPGNKLQPAELKASVDPQGRVHVIWSIVNSAGFGSAIYYARLDGPDGTWSEPVAIAEWNSVKLGVGQPSRATPAIIALNGQLWVSFQDLNKRGGAVTRSLRRSLDGGQTWSPPEQPFNAYVGTGGPAVFLVDGAGTLHMLFANRTFITTDTSVHGIWHAVWRNDQWTELEGAVAKEPELGFDPGDPQAVISQGNVMLVTWVTDRGQPPNGVWYTYASLDAPETDLAPLPTVAPTPVPTVTPAPSPTETSQIIGSLPTVQPGKLSRSLPQSSGGTWPVVMATVPALLVVSAFVVAYSLRRG